MKRILINVFTVTVVFILTILITSAIVNQDYQDLTTELSTATYPVVTVDYNGIEINRMYGYTDEMDLSYMRDSITPLLEGRKIHVIIDTYGSSVDGIDFEIRTVDGNRLVESTSVDEYSYNGGNVEATLTLKDLIDINEEYELIIILTTTNDKKIRYYSRVINTNGYYIYDKLEYVSEFSRKTFDKEEALDLKLYLESNSKADNTNHGYVDIHSSFDQITWGELNPSRVSKPIITIKELSPLTGSFIIDYFVSVNNEEKQDYYRVCEFYRIRYGKERIYLLDYERTMNQIFEDVKSSYSEDKILLGILSDEISTYESDDGNNIVFIDDGRLFEYNIVENKIAFLFGFYDIYTTDARMLNDDHKIKIMNVDEAGNVMFIVYGYMNRGDHEGCCGISAYYYNAQINSIEELAYIPSIYSPDLLIKKTDELSYMNSENILYFLLGSSLWSINAQTVEVSTIADSLKEDTFVISDNNHLVAYLSGDRYDSQRLVLMNLETGVISNIDVGSNDTLVPIDFIGEDLIYGIAHKEDMAKDRMGNIILPMYEVHIANEIEGNLMTYASENIYVVGGEVNSNQITLHRMEKVSDGYFVEILDDQIMNSDETVIVKSPIKSQMVDIYKKQLYLDLKKEINVNNMKHLNPKMVMYEGSREFSVEGQNEIEQFVVYGRYGADSIYSDVAAAVNRAYEISGIVMNEDGKYMYKKTARNSRNQIMAIKASESTMGKSSLAVSIDTMLEYAGVVRNSQYMLNQGYSVLEILNTALEGYEILDLTGCSLDTVLYYTNMDIPVLVMLNDESAVLLIGFNDKEVVIMNPDKNEIYKITNEEAIDWFKENGNCYITYLKS